MLSKSKQRIFSLFLAVVLALSLMPATAIQGHAAQTLNLTLTTDTQDSVREALEGAQAGDVINIDVPGEVRLRDALKSSNGADIHFRGTGSGSIITVDRGNNCFYTGGGTAGTLEDPEGALINVTCGNFSATGVTFDAKKMAGATVYAKGDHVQVTNCTFTRAWADVAWNTSALTGKKVAIDGCSFVENHGEENASSSTGLYLCTSDVGPVSLADPPIKITNTKFENNVANTGAGFYVYGEESLVYVDSSCSFKNNHASQRGGAFHCHGTVYVDGATFEGNNSDQYGGNIYISSNKSNMEGGKTHYGAVVLNNVSITDGFAGNSGGGVFIADNAALVVTGKTTLFGSKSTDGEEEKDNDVYVASANSKVVCDKSFDNSCKIGISTQNPYTGKDVVISPKNFDVGEADNYKLATDVIPGYDASYDASDVAENVAAFDYNGEGFSIVDDESNPGMMMLYFNSTTADVVFDFNIPGTEAIVYANKGIGDTINVPQVSDQENSGVTYKFKGWYTDPHDGQKITTPTVTAASGLRIYYAQWELSVPPGGGGGEGKGDMYLVYFDQNFPDGGSGLTAAYYAAGTFTWTVTVDGESKTYTAKLPFALPDDPLRPGYEFLGWAKTPDATAPEITPGWVPSETTTLFAVWKANTHTLTWDANGGEGGTTTSQDYDEVIKPPDTNPTREGYTFNGWYVDPGCSVAMPGDMTVGGDRTFYAGWTAEKVYVTYYDVREGTTIVGRQEYNYGDVLNALDGMTDTSGQTFIRWQTADGKPSTGIGELISSVPLTYHEGSGGDGIQSDAGYWTLDFYAVWEEKTTNYIATINWNDLQNNDGCRPKSIHIGLISSVNNREVAEATVPDDGTDSQTHTFTNLPITTADTSVEKITYSVYFKGYTDCNGTYRAIKDTAASSGEIQGATASTYDDAVYSIYRYAVNNFATGAAASDYSGVISLDHDLITTRDDLKFSIQWDDMQDNDGKRPDAVTLVLYANGLKVKDYPLHNSGTGVVSASPSICSVNKDGTVWTYIWKDYQKYSNGKAIDYTVAVLNNDEKTKFNANGYTTTYLNSTNEAVGAPQGAIISRPIDLVDKTVTIHWDDESNRDNLRPESVFVTLTAYQWNRENARWEEVTNDTAEVSGGVTNDTWTHTFPQVKKYNGGQEIIYMASISSDLNAHIPDGANGYSSVSNELDITVSHNRNLKSLPVKIEWDDHNNNDTIRPKTVILQLYADGKKLEGANFAVPFSGDVNANTWEYIFTNLPVYRDGKEGEEILYTFSVEEAVENSLYGYYISMANGQEEEIERYSASYMDADGNTTSELSESAYPYVKLTHASDQGSINLYANWHDAQNQDGKRPSSIQVDLYKQMDGVREFIKTYTVTAGRDNSWTYKVTGLPLYENGHEIIYLSEVSEDFRENLKENYGYTVSMEGPVVHLYYTPTVGYVSAHINWSDDHNNDNMRPDSVKGTLYANGKSTGQVLEFNKDNDWTQTWNDVDSYYNNNGAAGTPVTYSVVVEAPEGYAVDYVPPTTTTVDPQTINVTLSHRANTTSVETKVYWGDDSNQDGKRPDSVNIQLYANGEKVVGQTVDVTGSGDVWTCTFTDLPVYKDGQKIVYTVQANDNVTRTYSALSAGSNLYLSRNSDLADMSVSFRFDDGSNADGSRPEALYLHLTADGQTINDADYQKTIYFDVDGVKVTFVNLPVYSINGNKIAYNAQVSLDPEFGGTDYTVITTNDIKLSTAGNANQVVVTLKRGADTGTETGRIYWFDANNQRGNRPDSIVVDVRSDAASYVVGTYTVNGKTGEVTTEDGKVVGKVDVSEWGDENASCWTYTINNLTQNAIYGGQAHEIFYYATVRTPAIANWYTTVDGENNGLDINLTHKNYADDIPASKQDFAVTLNWLDNSNAWNYRPDSNGVDVTLYANGTEYKTIHLTKAQGVEGNSNAWTYTFDGLPTYLNGSAVVWSAKIKDVPMYTSEVSNNSDYCTIKMTQSIGFDFTTNWVDSDDDDAARPDSVTVEVYGDGSKVGEVVLTGEENTWTGKITDLAVWRESGASTPVSYSFQWSSSTNADLIDNYYTAHATKGGESVQADTFYYVSAKTWGDKTSGMNDLNGQYQWETTLDRNKETTTVYGSVTWDDDANRDGKRPESVLVQLYANGEPVGEPKELTGESTASEWPISWEEMDVYEGGKKIVYTTELISTPDDYTASVDETGKLISLIHTPETVSVTGTVNWLDSTEVHREYNSVGDLIRTYNQISRVDVYVQLLLNGENCGEPVRIPASGYQTDDPYKLAGFGSVTWDDLYRYADEGKVNEYTFKVYSSELDALLADGHSMSYDFETEYKPSASISHDLYDIRGNVYYLYTTSDEFLLSGVPVTAYLYDEETKTYAAVGSTTTDEKGNFELLNLPQGILTVRATYQKDGYSYAGSAGVRLDRCDQTARIIVNRDSQADSDLYRYSAQGQAFYQTDVTDKNTIHSVPEGSIVLLYEVHSGSTDATYVGMTTTDANGKYSFGDLPAGSYLVNVVFSYEGSTYTYDNGDAVKNGVSFPISGADANWPDIIKQVNPKVDPGPAEPDPDDPDVPDVKPEPCVVSGDVFYSDNGEHTTDPVAGVDVYVYTAANNTEVAKTTTNADGHWNVEGLCAGNYIAVFSYSGNASRVLLFTISDKEFEEGTYTAATQYFDRTTKEPTSTISGVVLDEDGNRMSALVQILNADGDVIDFAYTDDVGAYSFTIPAGFTYRVKILSVDSRTTTINAGDPDDAMTTLDYYTLTGNFSVNGQPQSGSTVSLYRQNAEGEFDLLTATLTNKEGNYSFKVSDAGNYRVVMYRNGQVYDTHNVSVGYQEYEPTVTPNDTNQYTISGAEAFDSLVLKNISDKVVRVVETLENGTEYSFKGLSEGTYMLELTRGSETKTYYIDVPDNVIDVKYFVTVSGTVVDEQGKPSLGAVVKLFNSHGKQVGKETVVTNGTFSYPNLPQDTYTIVVDHPVAGVELADKTTKDNDSFNQKYPNGMTEGSSWVWNINALMVDGTVKDQDGKPIEGATVVLKLTDNPEIAYGCQTDANGNWAAGVTPGSYTVSAIYEFDVNHIYHSVNTQNVTVTTKDISDVGLTINRNTLTGSVVRDGDDQPLGGANIIIKYPDGTQVWTGKADEGGTFHVKLYPDTYVVTVEIDGGITTQTIVIDGDQDATFKVAMPILLTGTVYDTDGKTPVSDGIVYFQGKTSGKVYTGKDGSFLIKINADQLGDYTLYAEAAGNQSEKVTVTVKTDTTKDLTLVSSGDGRYVVSGVVTDNEGNRLPNATVTLVYGNDKTKVIDTSTNNNGEYRFQVPDGTYYITVVYEDPNGNSYGTNGETAVHVDGADVTSNIAVTRAYEVQIRVVDINGDSVPGAVVTYQGASNGEQTADKDGIVKVKLAGGSYRFVATIGNRTSESKSVTVEKATAVELVVGLTGIKPEQPDTESHDNTISGYVIDPDGKPVKDADVTLYRFNVETEVWEKVDASKSAEDGYYEFTGLDNGRFKVEVSYSRTGSVTTETTSYEITGYAKDGNGNPYVGATVYLYLDGKLVSSVKSGEDGYYEFINLKQGNYTITIVPADGSGDETVTENKPSTPSNAVIQGVVIDINGKPVDGATVIVKNGEGGSWSTTTKEDGEYRFDLPAGGEYTVTIIYPDSSVVDAGKDYEKDPKDPIQPDLIRDSITISGYVHDTDDNPVQGATVILKDGDGNEVDRTSSGRDGYYEFTDKDPGTYTVIVIVKGSSQEYEVDTNKPNGGTDTPDKPDVNKIVVSGSVVTDHKRPLAGAVVTVKNLDNGKTITLTADKDGLFNTGDLDKGRYEIIAAYQHEYGINNSDPLTVTASQDGVVLVIILSYEADVNGDGEKETVYAGEDDDFDTPDDFYPADIDDDGKPEYVYAGEDGKPGTKDDHYPYDVDGDGKDEDVYVGDDRLPGTEDDYYLSDPDKDGKDDKIYAGEDGIPGTDDDFYKKDVDGDGKDEIIHVGEDGKPGTPDDYYEKDIDGDGKKEDIYAGEDGIPGTKDDHYDKDVDGDGEDEKVYVGEDGKPGTKDDWYEKDVNGDGEDEKVPVDIVEINFNANGGTVGGKPTQTIAKADFRSAPTASRDGYTFNGWFTAPSGGDRVSDSSIRAFTITTTVYAQWTKNSTETPGGGGGGAGGGGGGGFVEPPVSDIVVKIEAPDGVTVSPSGEQKVNKGDDLTITIKPNDGYEIVDIVVDGESKGPADSYTMKNISKSHTITIVARATGMLTTDHISYINGYPDGNVHPEANITRAEVATIFYRLLNDETRNAYELTHANFTDVKSGSWYETAVATLTNLGIIKGYSDGSFHPNANITRAEFATIAARFDKLEAGGKSFSDVSSSHWAYQMICSASAKGWINGYSDGTFRPEKAITRAETMTLVNRVLNRDTLTLNSLLSGMKTWPDNMDTAKWYYLAVQEATNSHESKDNDGVEVWTELN